MKPTVLELQNFRIQYGNEWITIKIKFSGHQTFNLSYPRALEINVARYANGFFGHIYRAEYFWFMQAVVRPEDGTTQMLRKRTKNAMTLTARYLKQLCEMEEDT